MDVLLFLLLPIAAFSGWLAGRKSIKQKLLNKYLLRFKNPYQIQTEKTINALAEMPPVDDDVLETHLTLGNIYRRRGELERAIHLHENLLQRQTLGVSYKSLIYLELARDYLAAGVLDRAECIFLELIAKEQQQIVSLQHLLDLYQQEKEWHAAIKIAKQLQKKNCIDLTTIIAHLYCELAEKHIKSFELICAKKYLRKALNAQNNFPRALILRAKIEQEQGNYTKAVKLYKFVVTQNIDYLQVVLHDIVTCYQQYNETAEVFGQQLKKNIKFRCSNCGFMSSKLQWHCPSCKQWDMGKPLESSTL